MEQIQCEVKGVFVARSETATVPAVILTDNTGHQLPIFIGLWEAVAINSALNGEVHPRPFTHDLLMDLLEKYAISVNRLQIDSIEEGVYYARLVLLAAGHEDSVDCRPSDGIAVALRAHAPIFVEEKVITEGSELNLPGVIDLATFLQK